MASEFPELDAIDQERASSEFPELDAVDRSRQAGEFPELDAVDAARGKEVARSSEGEGLIENLSVPSLSDLLYPGRVIASKAGSAMRGLLDTSFLPAREGLRLADYLAGKGGMLHELPAEGEATLTAPTLYESITRPLRRALGGAKFTGEALEGPTRALNEENQARLSSAMAEGGLPLKAAEQVGQVATSLLVDLLGFKAAGIGGGGTATREILHEAGKAGLYLFAVTPGDAAAKTKAAAVGAAFFATPAVTGKLPSDAAAIAASTLLNAGITTVVDLPHVRGVIKDSIDEAKAAGREGDWWKYTLTNLIPVYGPDVVFGLMAKSVKAANDPVKLRLATPDVLHDNLVEMYGQDKVQRAKDGSSVQVSLPDGRRVVYEFVGDEAQLRQKDPAAFFRSVRASKNAKDVKLAEDMLADANGDEAAAGRALKSVFESVGVTQRNVVVRDVATRDKVLADVLVQMVAGKAKIGDMKEEDLHAVLKLAGLDQKGGQITDPKTGRTLDEEGLARALNEGTQHPVAQKVRDLALKVTNMFRRDPEESLFQTAGRLRSDLADEQGAARLDARTVDRKAEGETVASKPGRVAAVSDTAQGPAWEAVTPKGEATVRGEWRVVDADQAVTSQDKGYNQDLQPRNRRTVASQEQILSIAQGPRPAELMDLPTTDGGAPIVDGAGHVISGNGRVLGLRGAYDAGRAEPYRAAVSAKAAELGLAVDPAMSKPVLVRVLRDSGGLALDRLAELSNQPKILVRSTAEMAEADGKLLLESGLIDGFQLDASGAIRSGSNRAFLEQFVQGAGANELLMTGGGFDPAIEGRVRRAVLSAVLSRDAQGRELVQDLVERGDTLGVQRQRDGVMAAGGLLVKLGRAKPEYDLTGDVGQALRDLVRFQRDRQAGTVKTLQDYLAQQEMFGTGRTDASLLLLKGLVESPSISATRGLLERYVSKADRIDTSTPDMFGEKNATALDVLRRAFNEGELAQADAGAVGAGSAEGTGERPAVRRREDASAEVDAEGARGRVGPVPAAGEAGRKVVPTIGSEGRPEFQGLEERLATRRREFDAAGRPMRGTALRVVNAEEFKDIAADVRANPEAYYDPQSLTSIRERTAKASDAELDAKLGPLDRLTAEAGADNDLMAHVAEKVMRLQARGDREGAKAAVVAMGRNLTTIAQLLRQAAILKTSTPEGMVGIVEALHEQKTGRPLGESNRKKLSETAEQDIKATGTLLEAQDAFRNKPGSASVERLDKATAAAEKAKRAWIARSAENLPKDWADMIRLLMQGNALTSSSIIANTVGNVINAPSRMVGRTIAATTEGVLSAFGLVKTRAVGQPLADSWAYVKGAGRAAKATGQTLRTGVNLQDILSGGEVARGFQPGRAWIRQATNSKLSANERAKLLVEGTVGIPAEAVFRMLAVTDAPFYGGAYEAALHEIGRLKGLDGKKLEQFLKVPDAEAKAMAEERAREAVYQGDSSMLAKAMVGLSRAARGPKDAGALERVAAELVMRPVMLFAKTPANVLSEAHKFLNPVYSAYDIARQISRGNQREAFQAWGRVITGTMIWSAVNAIVQAGLATGQPATDKERSLAQATLKPLHINVSGLKRMLAGEDPSLRPGDEQWDYRNLGIFGLALNIASTREEYLRNEAWGRGEAYDPVQVGTAERALGTAVGLPSALLDASMMKGTASLLQGVSQKNPWNWLTQWSETVSGVALPNTLRQVARYKFDEMPETATEARDSSERAQAEAAAREVVNRIKVKLYGARAMFGAKQARIEDLPVRTDLLGRPVLNTPESAGRVGFNFIDTRKPEEIPADKYAMEIRRVYLATGARAVIPSIPDSTMTLNGKTVRLDERQTARLREIKGRLFLWSMDNVMNSARWESWNDQQRAGYLAQLNESTADAAKYMFAREQYGSR